MTSPTHYSDHAPGVASTAILEHIRGPYERVSDLIGKAAGVERAFNAAVAASATLRNAENINTSASVLIGKTVGVERAMDTAMAPSAALGRIERTCAGASDPLDKVAAMDTAIAASAALNHVEHSYARTTSILRAADGIDAALRTSTMGIGAVAERFMPRGVTAGSRVPDAVLADPVLVPTPGHDIEHAPAQADDIEGWLSFLLVHGFADCPTGCGGNCRS